MLHTHANNANIIFNMYSTLVVLSSTIDLYVQPQKDRIPSGNLT